MKQFAKQFVVCVVAVLALGALPGVQVTQSLWALRGAYREGQARLAEQAEMRKNKALTDALAKTSEIRDASEKAVAEAKAEAERLRTENATLKTKKND